MTLLIEVGVQECLGLRATSTALGVRRRELTCSAIQSAADADGDIQFVSGAAVTPVQLRKTCTSADRSRATDDLVRFVPAPFGLRCVVIFITSQSLVCTLHRGHVYIMRPSQRSHRQSCRVRCSSLGRCSWIADDSIRKDGSGYTCSNLISNLNALWLRHPPLDLFLRRIGPFDLRIRYPLM